MDVCERLETAIRGLKPDRVPVIAPLGLPLLGQLLGPGHVFDRFAKDPLGTVVKVQEDLGLDPVIFSYSEMEGEVLDWPAHLLSWPESASREWRIEEEQTGQGPGYRDILRRIVTPVGTLSSRYRQEANGKWIHEHLLKDEKDLEILKYRPDPSLVNAEALAHMVATVGQRAFFMHTLGGVWTEACDLRGTDRVALDVYDRPEWLKRLLEMLTERQIRQMGVIAECGIGCIVVDETYVGMGISPSTFEEFVLPCDREVVRAAREEGLLVILHNCGKSRQLLELMADTGADGLETLTPAIASGGDVDLSDAKRRIGDRVCICGGFDEQVLASGSPDQVRDEVRRCLEAAAEGGGYIMRTAGQVLAARAGNIETMVETAVLQGAYR